MGRFPQETHMCTASVQWLKTDADAECTGGKLQVGSTELHWLKQIGGALARRRRLAGQLAHDALLARACALGRGLPRSPGHMKKNCASGTSRAHGGAVVETTRVPRCRGRAGAGGPRRRPRRGRRRAAGGPRAPKKSGRARAFTSSRASREATRRPRRPGPRPEGPPSPRCPARRSPPAELRRGAGHCRCRVPRSGSCRCPRTAFWGLPQRPPGRRTRMPPGQST
mmetsp:Transcript_115144/g.312520  ORF Transcript_115144/g.312520 Transcript_115144/m.312520 type:complete len:225 (-) Transcript_115144:515-1189(-)